MTHVVRFIVDLLFSVSWSHRCTHSLYYTSQAMGSPSWWGKLLWSALSEFEDCRNLTSYAHRLDPIVAELLVCGILTLIWAPIVYVTKYCVEI